jgi:ATP adenylyltransferase
MQAKLMIQDKPFYHPSVPYLHILHHLPDRFSFPVPATEDSNERLVDALAPALMATLDIMFDALRRGGVDRSGGWNLLMTL